MKRLYRWIVCLCLVAFVSVQGASVARANTDIIGILRDNSGGTLDRGNYQDTTPGVADYWDCNGYSVRACQILASLGYTCHIMVGGGHAFIRVFVDGQYWYYEPQIGASGLPNGVTYNPVAYTIEQYIWTYNAGHCQLPTNQLPTTPSTGDPSTNPASGDDPGASTGNDLVAGVGNDQSAGGGSTQPGSDQGTQGGQNEETPPALGGLFTHNGVTYRCPPQYALWVMQDGSLQCLRQS